MNVLLSIAAIANPIITATLTVLFYLERKKLEERNIALVSVGHRPTLKGFHENVLKLTGKGNWSLIPSTNYDFNTNIE